MEIQAFSTLSTYTELRQSVGVAVAKLTMDQNDIQAQALIRLMESSVTPNLGGSIDIRV